MKKKTFAVCICMMLLLPYILFLPACSGDGSIVGTWKITECIINGQPLTDMNDCFFYFYEDGTGKKVILEEEQFAFSYSYDGVTCVMFNIVYPDGEIEAGTYAEMEVHGNQIHLTANENGNEESVTMKRVKDTVTPE